MLIGRIAECIELQLLVPRPTLLAGQEFESCIDKKVRLYAFDSQPSQLMY